MATYSIQAPNGQTYQIMGPEGATDEQVQAEVLRQHPDAAGAPTQPAAPINEVTPEMQGGFPDEQPQQVRSTLSPEDEATLQGLYRTGSVADIQAFMQSHGGTSDPAELAAYVANRDKGAPTSTAVTYDFPVVPDDGAVVAGGRGAADTLTFGTLPKLGAGIAAAQAALHGEDAGQAYDRTLDLNNATIGSDEENHPWARVSGQLLGGLGLPSGLEGVGLKVGTDVLKAGGTMAEARVAAKIAVRNRMALVGGSYSAAHGAGSADTVGDAVTGAAVEGAIGAATGGLIGQAGRSTKPDAVASTVASDGMNVLQAAERQGIGDSILPADVGGPAVRRLTAAAAQAPLSASPVIEASKAGRAAAQGVRDRLAADIGQALDPEAAGLSIRGGAQKYLASSGADVRAAYVTAEKAAQGVRVAPTKAVTNLDQHIADLSETPGGAPGLAHMQALRDELAKGDVSVPGIMRMRTVLRDQFMRDGLRGSDVERRVGQVLDAAQQDVADSLTAAGKPGAARAYAAAAAKYKARIDTIDNVLKPIIGNRDAPRSGEAVSKTLMADLQGNNARAAKLLRTLPQEEQNTAIASVIGALGQKGEAFSLDQFETQWGQKIGESAKRAFFNPETRAALNDLYIVAKATKEAQSYANRSNTSGGIWGNVGAWLSASLVSPYATVAGIGGQYAAGRLLSSPKFTRWLARAPKTSLAPHAYVERLTRIARAEPAIANEVLALQKRLADAFTTGGEQSFRAAAKEPGDEPDGRDREQGERNTQQQSPTP